MNILENKIEQAVLILPLDSQSQDIDSYNQGKKELYQLTQEVACAFAEWKEENCTYYDFFYYLKDNNKTQIIEPELFAYFINNVYK